MAKITNDPTPIDKSVDLTSPASPADSSLAKRQERQNDPPADAPKTPIADNPQRQTQAVTAPPVPVQDKTFHVLLFAGHDEHGNVMTSEGNADEPFVVGPDGHAFPTPDINVGGQPYTHIATAVDGAWIYAPRDVKNR